ncbi:MAG: DUF5317 domain-containing protein [Armatimonadota bacterium]|nr:DUF5317 domain-containing protein [Armatimonadota bacterium]
MLLLAPLVLSLLLGFLRGGRIEALGEYRWRSALLPILALSLQIVAFLPDENASPLARAFTATLHVLSYFFLLAFVWMNRTTPWLWLVGLGLASNAVVILLNGGFMPVPGGPEGFYLNNTVRVNGQARLLFLGDILHLPAWWPLARAFSVGDLLIALGIFALVQRLMAAPSVPKEKGP